MPDIDSLQIKIEADSKQAKSGLDSLISTLDKLRSATRGGLGLTSVASGLTKITSAINTLNGNPTQKLGNLITQIERMRGLSNIKLSSTIARGITEIGDATGHVNHAGTQALGELITSLSSLQKVQNLTLSPTIGKSLSEIATASQLLRGVDFQPITEMTNAIAQLANITNIRLSSTIAKQIIDIGIAVEQVQGMDWSVFGNLAEALVPLGNIASADGLASLIRQLKKLPEIMSSFDATTVSTFSAAMQELGNALTPLAENIATVSGSMNAVPQAVEQANSAIRQQASANRETGNAWTELWSKAQVYINGMRAAASTIAKWVYSANNYIETYNLFTVSMGEFADKAERYAERVSEAMGIDPSEWMRAQGVFNTLATGFGVASDKAYTMSQNLTQLSYDLASFFNMSVNDATIKVRGALSGEIEMVRQLGIDLSNARLQEEATAMGIKEKVTAMSQAEKAMLRYKVLMSSTTKAQGDMARTLQNPANQLRILKSQIEMAGRALGNIFIPALNAILPYCIAAVKAIRMVAVAIASLFGQTLSEVDWSGITSTTDATKDLTDGLDEASGAAKELQKYTMGFDELNVISPSDDSGGGSGSDAGDDWNFDVDGYDFFGQGISKKVDEIFKGMKEWLDKLLPIIGSIAAGLAEWKLATSFIDALANVSGKVKEILGAIATAAVIVITVWLNYEFGNAFLETGKYEYLVAQAIITALGAALAYKLAEELIHEGAGAYAAGITLLITGLVDMALTLGHVHANGWDEQALLEGMLSALQVGAGFAFIMWGYTKDLGIAGAAFGVGFTATISALALLSFVDYQFTKGAKWSEESFWELAIAALSGGISAGLAAYFLIGETLPTSAAAAGAVAAVIFSVGAMMKIIAYSFAEDGANWGFEEYSTLALSALSAGVSTLLTAKVFKVTDLGTKLKAAGAVAAAVFSVGMLMKVVGYTFGDEPKKWGLQQYKDSALSALSAGTSALLAAKAFSLTPKQQLLAAGAATMAIFTVGALLNMIDYTMQSGKPWSKQAFIADGVAALSAGASTLMGLLAFNVGMYPSLVAAGCVAVAVFAIGAALNLVAYTLNKEKDLKTSAAWGDLILERAEMVKAVAQVICPELTANIKLVDAKLVETKQYTEALTSAVSAVEATLQPLEIGVEWEKDVYTKLYDQMLGEQGVVPKLNALSASQQSVVELALKLSPAVDENGNIVTEEVLAVYKDTDGLLQTQIDALGKQLGVLLMKGSTEGVSEMEQSLIIAITDVLNNVAIAAARGEAQGTFKAKMAKLFSGDITKDTFSGILQEFETFVSGYNETAGQIDEQAFASIYSKIAEIDTLIASGMLSDESLEAFKKQKEKLQKELDSIKFGDPDVSAEREKLFNIFKGIYEDVFKKVDEQLIGDGVDMTRMFQSIQVDTNEMDFTQISTRVITELQNSIQGTLDTVMNDEDKVAYLAAKDVFGFTDWDMLGEETKRSILDQLGNVFKDKTDWSSIGIEGQKAIWESLESAFGASGAKQMLTALGYDIKELIKAGIIKDPINAPIVKGKLDNDAIAKLAQDAQNILTNGKEVVLPVKPEVKKELIPGLNTDFATFSAKDPAFLTVAAKLGEGTAQETVQHARRSVKSAGDVNVEVGVTIPDSEGESLKDRLKGIVKDKKLELTAGVNPDTSGVQDAIDKATGKTKPTVQTIVELVKQGKGKEAWDTVASWVVAKGKEAIEQIIQLTNQKNGDNRWESVSEWVKKRLGSGVQSPVTLIKNGWTTVTNWVSSLTNMGSALITKAITLGKDNWATTISDWLNLTAQKGADKVTKNVTLGKDNWVTTICDWLNNTTQKGTAVVGKAVTLQKDNWSTTISDWLNNAAQKGSVAVQKAIGIIRDGWESVSDWVNASKQRGVTVVNQKVGLTQQDTGKYLWDTVSKWVSGLMGNTEIIQKVGITNRTDGNNGFTTVSQWLLDKMMGGEVNKPIGLTQLTGTGEKVWKTVSEWVSNFMGNKEITQQVGLTPKSGNDNKSWASSVAQWLIDKMLGGNVNKEVGLTPKTGSDNTSWSGNGSIGQWLKDKFFGDNVTINKQVGLTPQTGSGTTAWSGSGSVGQWLRDKMMGSSVNKEVGITNLNNGTENAWSSVSQWVSNHMGTTKVTQVVGISLIEGFALISQLLVAKYLGETIKVKVDIEKVWGKSSIADYVKGDAGKLTVPVNPSKQGSNWESYSTMAAYMVDKWSAVIGKLTVAVNLTKGSGVTWKVETSGSGSNTTVKLTKNGGMPKMGQMFVAREAGPELVGTIGGKTSVMNNDMIVESVSAGVYEAVVAAMGGASSGGEQNINVYLDGREIYASQQRVQNANGYRFST